MREATPSTTAMRVAMRRAAHQMFDVPTVLDDPVAVAIIGPEARAQLRTRADDDRMARALRAFLAARSRLAEEELARAMHHGATQYVILGAGLDTFAYRNPYEPALRVFEVDHPATQAWKHRQLAAASIDAPSSLVFAPVDFERQSLADGLERVGFDRHASTFFSWLGVTMYLTDEAIQSTLAFVASTPRGGGLVFDYAVPRSSLAERGQRAFDEITRRTAAAGEPFRSFFTAQELRDRLAGMGFDGITDLSGVDINRRYFSNRADGLTVSESSLTHLLSAAL